MNFFYYFFICIHDIKIQEYGINTLNFPSATSMLLKLVPIPGTYFFFPFSICFSVLSLEGWSDLELPFCQLWNKQLQFSSCFQRPLPISFLSQLCSFLFQLRDQQPWFADTTFRREERTPWHYLPKKIRIQFKWSLYKLKMKLLFKWAKGKHLPTVSRYESK